MAEKKLGLAIVGWGMIGKFHAGSIEGVPSIVLTGALDTSRQATGDLNASCGIRAYRSFDEVLSDPSVDVVDICLPSGLHAEYGCLAAEAGKHVIVEKPIDITLERANRLIDTCRRCGTFLAVILQNRFAPSAVKMKQAIRSGVLGRIIAGEATIKWYRPESYYTSSRWKGTKQFDGGGALMNQGIHTIDLLLWFLGSRVKRVASLVKTAVHPIEVEDLAMAIAELEGGAIASVTGSTAMKPGFPERIEIYGEKGSIALEAGRIVRWKVDGHNEEDHLDVVPARSGNSDPGGIPLENHRAQFAAIGDALLRGEQPPVAGEEAIKALKFILDIYAANGTWVTVDSR